jgi:DNA-binding response OmpR family regulator
MTLKHYVPNEKPVILALDDASFELTRIKDIITKQFDMRGGPRYDLRIAKRVIDAFSILNSVHVDLILLDVGMPDMSGIDFLQFIKKQTYFVDCKVIFLTAHTEKETVQKAVHLGAFAFIKKPVDPEELLTKIKEALGRSQG